jgi:hypothetical protein
MPHAVWCSSLVALLVMACGSRTVAPTEDSPSPSQSPLAAASSPPAATIPPSAACVAQGRVVSTAAELQSALASATPGAQIDLAPGTYAGHFVIKSSGTAAAPSRLCGPRTAILDGGDIASGYTFYLDGASWWVVSGFTVQHGQKGVMTDRASHNVISGLLVQNIGDEGIHLRSGSSDNIIEGVTVRNTGLHDTKFGEGIYVGSAVKNWCVYTSCGPDRSDGNIIRGNDVAHTTAENIDIKEGTTGGTIADNQLSGVGMVASAATAWINVKGNDWLVEGNVGDQSLKDGFQVHEILNGWGRDNVFKGNVATVDGPGYAIYVEHASLGTQVACDNKAIDAGSGLSNVPCT